MPTPIIPSGVKVTCRFTLFNQIIENVWGCHPGGTIDLAELQSIAADFASVTSSDLMPFLSSDVTFIDVEALDVSIASGINAVFTVDPPVVGSVDEPSSPSNVAVCISLVSAVGGRSGRGRKYFSGIQKSGVVADVVDTAITSALINYVGSLISTLSGNGHPLAILSPTTLALHDVIGSQLTDSFSDSQRRRLVGRGK